MGFCWTFGCTESACSAAQKGELPPQEFGGARGRVLGGTTGKPKSPGRQDEDSKVQYLQDQLSILQASADQDHAQEGKPEDAAKVCFFCLWGGVSRRWGP